MDGVGNEWSGHWSNIHGVQNIQDHPIPHTKIIDIC